jgi:hypothetical protein
VKVKYRDASLEQILANTTRNENGCMVWNGTKKNGGYGVISLGGGRFTKVTRIVMSRLGYNMTDKKKYVCHKCDNTSCVNPDHLFIGSSSDNQKDHWQKVKEGKTVRWGWIKGVLHLEPKPKWIKVD